MSFYSLNFFLLLITTLIRMCHGYWRMPCGIVQTGRIDPVVSPGKVSGHVHKIAGASNIGPNSTYNSLQNASCTSCEIQADKSGYWTPQLYYHHSNGSFEEVPAGGMVVYYLGRGDNRTNIQPFPPGFRMVSGDAGARAYDNETMTFAGTAGVTYVNGTVGNGTLTGGTFVNGTTANGPRYNGRTISDRVSFNCLDVSPLPETPNMVRTNCSNGLRAQIQFQSCWDGVNLYKSDQSHVAYMSQIDNGVCPPQYPVQLVHLFFEVLYGTNNIDLDGGEFVFAQGDTTGYGFHGDFLNGWDMPTQTAGLAQCANTDNGGVISACEPFALTDSTQSAYNCPQQPALIDEPARGMISKLPGCITITSGPQEATSADMLCPVNATVPTINATPASTGPTTTFLPTVGTVYNKWKYLGCVNETTNGRSLSGASYVNMTSMSNEVCQAFCASKNYPIAGTEYGTECYCGLALSPSSSLGQNCNPMICSGNSSELCGGPSLLNVWNSTTYSGAYKSFPSTLGAVLDSSSVYLGCATDNGSSRALSAASFTNSTGMTLDACMSFCASHNYAIWGTEYSSECYCGSSLLSTSTLSPPSTCAMPCSGNSSQTCGGPSLLTVFNNTAIVPPPPAITAGTSVNTSIYLGCTSEATSGRALNASSYTAANMTNAVCAAYCQSKNYALFGTEYSSQCYCSNGLAAGATYPQTGCTMPCAGNLPAGSPYAAYANLCGGPNRISLWNNTLYKPVQVVASVGAYKSQGCYAEGTKGRALASTSWAAPNMTVEACVGFCQGKGWGYAGVEYADECYCGSGISNGGGVAPDGETGCDMLCAGSQYEFCGGPNRLNVYSVS